MNIIMIKTVGLCMIAGVMSGSAWNSYRQETAVVGSAEYMRKILQAGVITSSNPWSGAVQAHENSIIAIDVPDDVCKTIAWSTPVFTLLSVNGMPAKSGDPSWTCSIAGKSTIIWSRQK